MLLDYGIVSVDGFDVSVRGIVIANLDHGSVHLDGFDVNSPALAELDHVSMHLDAYDASGVAGSLEIKFLKAEFCRFEDKFKTLKVRVKIQGLYHPDKDNIFTAKIITALGMEYELTTWTEVISESTTKLIKEYDLNLVVFPLEGDCDIDLPLNIGTHTLEVSINDTTTSETFKVVPITVDSIKSQHLLGVELESSIQLGIQQDLRLITGVEVTEVSRETAVGAYELVWDVDNSTLQWADGEPVAITDDETEYILTDYMVAVNIVAGSYIRVQIDDIDNLPTESKTEIVLIDVTKYDISDFQYWINVGYQTLMQTIVNVDIEPTLYSSNKELVATGYKFLPPVLDLPKSFSETTNYSFEFPVNMLQCIVELWAQYFANGSRINIDKSIITHSEDGEVTIRRYPYGLSSTSGGSNAITFGQAGLFDRSMYAKNHHGARNKTKNFFQGTVVAGINDKDIRDLALSVASRITAISLLLAAGLGRGAGVASRSFSVGGISSSYASTESAENSLYSGVITDLQRGLGLGKATKDERAAGLTNLLKKKIEGGSMAFKY